VNLGEAEAVLPNGLHDAELIGFAVDYVTRTARFEFNAWVGDLSSHDHAIREKHQQVSLSLSGLRFLIVEKPDPTYGFQSGVPTIQGFSAWGGKYTPPEEISHLVEQLPATSFFEATFVDDWTSFIHIGADAAEIKLMNK
jgi:hypothetical protein